MCNLLFLQRNCIMFVRRKDFNILLQIYRYKIKPTLFFNCVVITIWLLHCFLRCIFCSTNCKTKIDFSELYLSLELPKCPLIFSNVRVIWWNNAWFIKSILEIALRILLDKDFNLKQFLAICLRNNFIKTEYAIVNIKHKFIDLLKNYIYSKKEDSRE